MIEFYIEAPERAFRNPEIINEVLAALASEIDSGKTVIHLGYDE